MNKTGLDPQWIGKTFDDFLFRPCKGQISSRSLISLQTQLTRNIPLELPIVSANMDSVTGRDMAEAMALEGGLGVIHRGQSIDRQAELVPQLKGLGLAVTDPATGTNRRCRCGG